MKLLKKKSKGFTLVELIVVIAILVILAAILIPTMTGVINDAKEATGKANARSVYSAAMAYVAKEYPTVAAGDYTQASSGNPLEKYLGSGFANYAFTVDANGNVTVASWNSDTKKFTFTASTQAFTVESLT